MTHRVQTCSGKGYLFANLCSLPRPQPHLSWSNQAPCEFVHLVYSKGSTRSIKPTQERYTVGTQRIPHHCINTASPLSLIPAKNLWNHMWFQYLKSPRNPRACAVRPRSTHHAGLGLHWGPLLLPQPRAGRYWPPGHRVICDCSWDLMRLPVPMILPKPPPRYRSLVIARIDTNPWCHKHPLGSPVDIRWAWCAVAPL